MGVNRVDYGDETIIDISDSSVTPANLLSGAKAYGADGEEVIGEMTVDDCYKTTDTVSSTINDTDYIPLSDADGNKKKSLWTTFRDKIWTYVSSQLSKYAKLDEYNTFEHAITIDTSTTGGNVATLNLGNNKSGDGSCFGDLKIFAGNGKYTEFYHELTALPTTNTHIWIPTESGTMALTSDIPDVPSPPSILHTSPLSGYNVRAYKYGNMVTITSAGGIFYLNQTYSNWVTLFTLASAYRPKEVVYANCTVYTGSTAIGVGFVRIDTAGKFQFWTNVTATKDTTQIHFNMSYVVW